MELELLLCALQATTCWSLTWGSLCWSCRARGWPCTPCACSTLLSQGFPPSWAAWDSPGPASCGFGHQPRLSTHVLHGSYPFWGFMDTSGATAAPAALGGLQVLEQLCCSSASRMSWTFTKNAAINFSEWYKPVQIFQLWNGNFWKLEICFQLCYKINTKMNSCNPMQADLLESSMPSEILLIHTWTS